MSDTATRDVWVMRVIAMNLDGAGARELDRVLYVQSFDVNAHDGRGEVRFVSNPQAAMRFATVAELTKAWRTQSTVRPLRAHDGKPNRPLTAMTIETEKVSVTL